MLSRFISRPSYNLRFLTLISSSTFLNSSLPPPRSSPPPLLCNPNLKFILETSRCFSSNRNNNGDDTTKSSWKISSVNDDEGDSIFREDGGDLSGITDESGGFDDRSQKVSVARSNVNEESWSKDSSISGDIFGDIEKEFESKKSSVGGGDDEWETAEGYKPWSFVKEDEGEVFDVGDGIGGFPSDKDEDSERRLSEADQMLQKEKEVLSAQLKGPNRAFGDLIATSGITDAMLDSLIALKDLENVDGLPPLREIEDIRLAKNERKSTRAELERQKQEEIAKSRVRRVDDKGRAYGTGRRKCSVARVFIQPGDGKFIINDKQFDVYFPILDHRADLLRPFSETQTLGLWDVTCTVKGGGVSGQVGAVRLGISRALQNWEPGLRPPLRQAGFLTRDPRMVERKKPGKAKARKSFQWVKR